MLNMDMYSAFDMMHENDGTTMKKHPNQIMKEKIERYNRNSGKSKKLSENEQAYAELMRKVKEKLDEKKSGSS